MDVVILVLCFFTLKFSYINIITYVNTITAQKNKDVTSISSKAVEIIGKIYGRKKLKSRMDKKKVSYRAAT